MAEVPFLPLSLMKRLDFQADFSEDEEPASSPAHNRSGAKSLVCPIVGCCRRLDIDASC